MSQARTLSRELDACREADGRTGRFWKIINPNHRNVVGKHPGYKLVAQASPVLLAQPGSSIAKRGGFASKHLWVTRFAEEERYATGNYPNQHAGGDGLPRGCSKTVRLRMKTSWFGTASVSAMFAGRKTFPSCLWNTRALC